MQASQSRVREVVLLAKMLYRKLIRQAEDDWKAAEDRSSMSWWIARSIGHDDERLNVDVHERMLVPCCRDTQFEHHSKGRYVGESLLDPRVQSSI